MSSTNYHKDDFEFPDAEAVRPPGLTEDKLIYDESFTVDSGFLSGGDIVFSGEIKSEEISPESEPVRSDLKVPVEEPELMRLDSGIELSEKFCNLTVKYPNMNDLNGGQRKTPALREPGKKITWEMCYEQDEEGDT